MFWHTSKEKYGRRFWFHLGGDAHRKCIGIELGWWHSFCHVGVEVDDEGWNLSLAFPPLAVWVSLEGFPIWQPKVKHMLGHARNEIREVWLPDRRECRIAVHDWAVWINPWSKLMEWTKSDPWWVRGLTFHVDDFVLGKTRYTHENTGPVFIVGIPMPEGNYAAEFTPQRQTWKRPRWFSQVRESFDVNIPKGIPFAGKGENSWDCGDDGLFGMGAEGTVEQAIAKVRDTVMERRRRYGSPSDAAIREALA